MEYFSGILVLCGPGCRSRGTWSPPSVLVYKARINHLLIPTSVGAAKPEREKAACKKYYLHIQKCVATTKSQITVLNNNKFMYI